MKFVVIGITDNSKPGFSPEVIDIIKHGKVFSGGKRHHEIVAPFLPTDAEWIDITAPIDAIFEQYDLWSKKMSKCLNVSPSIVVFASGDPLFFGFANTIKRKMPEAEIVVYPTFNSLQMLAHRLVMPYHDMRIVSLTGRPWQEFDKALIENSRQRFQALQAEQKYGMTGKIGVLTDREHTPAAIAQRMLEYGYTDYTMYVGEHLGNPAKEKVTTLSLEEAAQRNFDHPNCIILNTNYHKLNTNCPQISFNENSWSINGNSCLNERKTIPVQKPFGIPDSEFALLDGREKMITKMPIRLLTLQALDLPSKHVFWDIGFCTGSVSIEARLLFPHLEVHAFEIRPECEAIIQENARRHGAPGINVHIGDFLSTPLPLGEGSGERSPDAVFIGGHGGRLKEIMQKVLTVLAPGGVIVFNSVTSPVVAQMTDRPTSRQLWDEACQELSLRQAPPLHIQLNDHNPIEILKAYNA